MMTKQNVALVVGSTGIVGEALTELLSKPNAQGGPWKVYGLARRPRPTWLSPEDLYVQCDLLNRDDTFTKLSPLIDVTHLFWAAWIARPSEEENCAANGQMLQNAVDALLPSAKGLEHIALQTGGKHYMGFDGSFMSKSTKVVIHETPFVEDLPRHPFPNFYYTMEDIVFKTVEQQQGKLTWSVHRSGMIFGHSCGNVMNILGTIAVYGTICKHQGLPFRFPGNHLCWESLEEAGNADLIAEQGVWAATDPRGKNQAFNVMNGDYFRWKTLWKLVAEKLGLEYIESCTDDVGISLSEVMKEMGPVWDQIVQQNGLYPSKLEDVGHWWFAEWIFNNPGEYFMNLNKSKEHGFLGFRNTEKTVLSYFDKMQDRKLIP